MAVGLVLGVDGSEHVAIGGREKGAMLMPPSGFRSESAEEWLVAIRDSEDESRLGLVEGFYQWARPVVRRASASLKVNAGSGSREGLDGIELVVNEALLVLVADVVRGRKDPASGRALFATLVQLGQARLREHARKHSRVSRTPIIEGLRDVIAGLHLDRPHLARISHGVSGSVRYAGPFADVVEALREAEKMEASLRARDVNWKVTAHPLLDPVACAVAPEDPGSVGRARTVEPERSGEGGGEGQR